VGHFAFVRRLEERERAPVRRRLVVGRANDPAEHEADATSERVMAWLSSEDSSSGAGLAPSLEATRIRRSTTTPLMPEAGPAGGALSEDLDQQIRRAGGGRPIAAATRSRFEAAFGASFADVRVHTDSDVAPRIAASAFTVGRHIHFAPGQYRPETTEGVRTLAHELTHVVQQAGPVQRAFAGELIQREWVPGGGGSITTSSGAYKKGFGHCCDEIDEVPTSVGTMVRVDQRGNVVHTRREEYVRIDMQEFTKAGWLNIQCQVGSVSMAGILCPPNLPVATMLAGLRLAIANNRMYTWVPDDADVGGKGEKGGGKGPDKGGGGKGPGKGGKGGRRGGKGGGGFQGGRAIAVS
jgi:hypothetical protein